MIAAVLLAAGESIRMGIPKLAMPWRDDRSLIACVVQAFAEAGASPILVVTGGDREKVEGALTGEPVRLIYNANYASGGMLSTIQIGLRALTDDDIEAAMICPGDLPFLQPSSLGEIMRTWTHTSSRILAPSYRGRRGHPILVARALWPEILSLEAGTALRDWLNQRGESIEYILTEDAGVIKDVDTPEDFRLGFEARE